MKRGAKIALAIISVTLLASGITFAGLVAQRLAEAEPPAPSGIPSSLSSEYLTQVAGSTSASNAGGAPVRLEHPQLIGNALLPVSQGQTFFIAPYGREMNLTVNFDDVLTFRGRMEGSNATLTIVSQNSTSKPATTIDEHISFSSVDVSAKEKEIPTTPWIKVPIVFNESENHSWVVASAEVLVRFYITRSAGPAHPFDLILLESAKHLQRNLVFFVVSPQEYQALERHNDWASISFGFGVPQADRSLVILEYTICALVGIIGGGALLYQIYRRK